MCLQTRVISHRPLAQRAGELPRSWPSPGYRLPGSARRLPSRQLQRQVAVASDQRQVDRRRLNDAVLLGRGDLDAEGAARAEAR